MVLIRTDVSKERLIFIIRVKRISELGTTLAVTIKGKHTAESHTASDPRIGFTPQKTALFIVTAVEASNLTI
jgi:hypothetical protein